MPPGLSPLVKFELVEYRQSEYLDGAMNSWVERVKNHGVYAALRDLDSSLSLAAKKSELGPHQIDLLGRMRSVAAAIQSNLEDADPLLISISLLDSIQDTVRAWNDRTTRFVQEGSELALEEALNLADGAIDQFSRLLTNPNRRGRRIESTSLAAYQETIGRYIDEVGTRSRSVQASLDSQTEALAQLRNEIDQQRSRLDSAIIQFQQQFSEAQETRNSRYAELTERINTEYRAQSEKWETDYRAIDREIRDSQTQWSRAVDDVITKGNVELTTAVESARKEVAGEIESIAGKTEKLVDEIDANRIKAAELVEITANIAVTGHFKREADIERKQADLWRLASVISTLLIIAPAVWAAMELGAQPVWESALARFAFSLPLIAIAAYAAKESGNHRNLERRNRRMELELAAIRPFLEPLEKPERDKLISTLAERIFAQPGEQVGDSPTAMELFKVVERVADNLSKKN